MFDVLIVSRESIKAYFIGDRLKFFKFLSIEPLSRLHEIFENNLHIFDRKTLS